MTGADGRAQGAHGGARQGSAVGDRRGDRLGQRGRRSADQAGQVAARPGEQAAPDGLVDVDEDRGEGLGQPGADEDLLVHGGRDVLVDDLLAGLLGHHGGVLGERPGDVAAQLVRRAGWPSPVSTAAAAAA